MYYLTDEQKQLVHTLKSDGFTLQAIADRIGCSRSTVHRLTGGERTRQIIRNAQDRWREANPDRVRGYQVAQTAKTRHELRMYIAYSSDQPHMFKIGITACVPRRLVTLRTGAPHMEIILQAPATALQEKSVHATLEHRRIQDTTAREWFNFASPSEAIEVVTELLEGFKSDD